MSVIKVIELIAQSDKGWEDAAQMAIEEACKSVRDIDSIYAEVGKVRPRLGNKTEHARRFRINARISFVVGEEASAATVVGPAAAERIKGGRRRSGNREPSGRGSRGRRASVKTSAGPARRNRG
jgi:dodecin